MDPYADILSVFAFGVAALNAVYSWRSGRVVVTQPAELMISAGKDDPHGPGFECLWVNGLLYGSSKRTHYVDDLYVALRYIPPDRNEEQPKPTILPQCYDYGFSEPKRIGGIVVGESGFHLNHLFRTLPVTVDENSKAGSNKRREIIAGTYEVIICGTIDGKVKLNSRPCEIILTKEHKDKIYENHKGVYFNRMPDQRKYDHGIPDDPVKGVYDYV
jgi:hypothetical protein